MGRITLKCIDMDEKKIECSSAGKILFVLLAYVTVPMLLICAIYFFTYHYLYRDVFLLDVENTFINNLFGTGRFSAFPVVKVSIFHFLVLNCLAYCSIKRLSSYGLNARLFLLVNVIDVMYIMFIGGMYILRWARENFQRTGEYLAGFEGYMIPTVGLIYLYWGYEMLRYLRHKRR